MMTIRKTSALTAKFKAAIHVAVDEFGMGGITARETESDRLYSLLSSRGWMWQSLFKVWYRAEKEVYVSRYTPFTIISVQQGIYLPDLDERMKRAFEDKHLLKCYGVQGEVYLIYQDVRW